MTSKFSTRDHRLMRLLLLTLTIGLAPSGQSQSPPLNDAFTNRILFTGSSNTVAGSNVDATSEGGERYHSGNVGGKSVWWTWTAPVTGTVLLDTTGSSFDTMLAVYTGSGVGSVFERASNDDADGALTSKLNWYAFAGQEFQIAVDGYLGASGDVVLNLRCAPAPPRITVHPGSQHVVSGAGVGFSSQAFSQPFPAPSSYAPLHYQWQKDEVDLPGATNQHYSISSVAPAHAGVYRVVVTNEGGITISSNALLTVNVLTITEQPFDVTRATGYSSQISAKIGGGQPPVKYQWFKDGVALHPPQDPPFDSVVSWNVTVQPSNAGVYHLVVSNASGATISSNATLSVTTPYTFTTIAGFPGQSGTNDGVGRAARFYHPHGIDVDQDGNLYVADIDNHTIRKVAPDGTVTTLAGMPGVLGTNNGAGTAARFRSPWALSLDHSRSNLLIADTLNHAIRRVTLPGGVVTTIAGTFTAGQQNGPASVASFDRPAGVIEDAQGNIFIADWTNGRIRKMDTNGIVQPFVGSVNDAGGRDGKGAAAALVSPSGFSLDEAGNLYFVNESTVSTLRKATPDGYVTTLAGNGTGYRDGPGPVARFWSPHGWTRDSAGNLYIADTENRNIRRVNPSGHVTTLGGSNFYGSVDGVGARALFKSPRGIVVDQSGTLYITDYDDHTIRKGIPFAVTTFPRSQAAAAGSSVTLSATVAGVEPVTCQWFFEGVSIPGATNVSLQLSSLDRTNTGKYSLVVSNGLGQWSSLDALLRVLVPPVIEEVQLLSSTGRIRLLFRDSDGGVPYDINEARVQWRATLPLGSDTNWITSPTGVCYFSNGFVVHDHTVPANVSNRFFRILER